MFVQIDCVLPCIPTDEICNNKDDNCNGQTDENLARQCGTTDIGECEYGVQTCSAGSWGSCSGNIGPTAEICDGLDNDCDGQIDEDLIAPNCDNQEGVCAGSKKICRGASGWLDCNGYNYGPDYQIAEVSCDGLDNDCDGEIDDGVKRKVYKDNDGDGQGNETDFDFACSVTSAYAINDFDCDDNDNNIHSGATEICDKKDNDCNGEADDNVTDCYYFKDWVFSDYLCYEGNCGTAQPSLIPNGDFNCGMSGWMMRNEGVGHWTATCSAEDDNGCVAFIPDNGQTATLTSPPFRLADVLSFDFYMDPCGYLEVFLNNTKILHINDLGLGPQGAESTSTCSSACGTCGAECSDGGAYGRIDWANIRINTNEFYGEEKSLIFRLTRCPSSCCGSWLKLDNVRGALPLPGDANRDCVVNIFDLAAVGLCYGQPPAGGCEGADLNQDGAVNIFDLASVGLNYGSSC